MERGQVFPALHSLQSKQDQPLGRTVGLEQIPVLSQQEMAFSQL